MLSCGGRLAYEKSEQTLVIDYMYAKLVNEPNSFSTLGLALNFDKAFLNTVHVHDKVANCYLVYLGTTVIQT